MCLCVVCVKETPFRQFFVINDPATRICQNGIRTTMFLRVFYLFIIMYIVLLLLFVYLITDLGKQKRKISRDNPGHDNNNYCINMFTTRARHIQPGSQ